MPLSNKDLSDIAKEFAIARTEQSDDKDTLSNIQEQVIKKQEQYDRINILYKDSHVERVTPYELEHRWLDGTIYSTITEQQIQDAGLRTATNIFFPADWTKPNAQLTASGNGNPKTSSTDSEYAILNTGFDDDGLIPLVAFLRNGQVGSTSKTLSETYSPGEGSLTFLTAHSFTPGKYLYISGSGTSALVKITGVSLLTIFITEIIPPASVIAIGGSVVENIPGFTNLERQNLTSTLYQRILTQLTTKISTAAALYIIPIVNQLAQLTINVDAPTQVTAAKASANAAKTAYNTWFALAATGVSGKWIDTSLNAFTASYISRKAGISSRVNQIVVALGSVSQDGEGNYSGDGNYHQRFKCLNFLINSANGPLYQINGFKAAKGTFEQKIINVADKLATFSNLVRYGGFIKDPTGNSVEVDGASQFAAGNNVLLSGNNLPSIECTISSVSGKVIVLSITIPPTYSKAAKGSIIKKV